MIEMLLRSANQARIAGQYQEADRRFADARRRIASAPLSTCIEAAQLYSLEASLRLEQFRPLEAAELLAKAESIARGHDDGPLLARVTHKQGLAADDLGYPGLAIRRLLAAKRLYREQGNEAADVLGLAALVVVLAGVGQTDRAFRYHICAAPAAKRLLDARALRTYEWVRGVIALRAGLYTTALAIFDQVVAGAAAAGDAPVGATALLDVVEARAGVGDFEGVELAADQLASLFRSMGVPPPVLAATDLLAQVARCRVTALAECVATIRMARR